MPTHDRALARVTGLLALVLTAGVLAAPADSREQSPPQRLILVTFDGARTEEIFGGLDVDVATSTLGKDQRIEDHGTFSRLLADTPEARRAKLMPFFWNTLVTQQGSIAGNARLGSRVTLTNTHRFSFPGYAEILLGEAHDDVIKSNDPVRIPYPTILEGVRARFALPSTGVGLFASWSVFSAIGEHEKGAITLNAGYEPFRTSDPAGPLLNQLQVEAGTPWNEVRHDAYTFRFAMDFLKTSRPLALHLALGETDDWAHDGRYDRVLEAYQRSDKYLEQLWTWLQSDPEYRGRTHILITTDHGRGHTVADWRKHGEDIEGAQDVWMAFISPTMKARGEWRDRPAIHTNQAAATMASWLGFDWVADHPNAGAPVQ